MKPTNAMLDRREQIRTAQNRTRKALLLIAAFGIVAIFVIVAIT